MYSRALLCIAVAVVAAASASAQNTAIHILFYTGKVTVTSGKTSRKASIGLELAARDELRVGRGGSVQISVNGKVIQYSQAGKVRVADAIKRAGTGENTAVATTVGAIAATTGADREPRTDKEGTTRLEEVSQRGRQKKKKATREITATANRNVAERAGIEEPPGTAERIGTASVDQEDMIILEPRSTAVSSGPILFRWLRSTSAGNYIVAVKNYLGEEIFRRETSDTALIWESPGLTPEIIYTWTLTDANNAHHGTGAMFHRLADSADAMLRTGLEEIRRELGSTNPAMPLILGAFYADIGCYGQAARCYTEGARTSKQHYREFMHRACNEYLYEIYMPEEEVLAVYREE